MKEIWRDIKDYEGLYQVSNTGKIKSLDRKVWNYIKKGKIIKTHIVVDYEYVVLYKNKTQKNYRVHRLVANAFILNPNNYKEVNHIDGNKLNNNVSNLEWCSRSQNLKHAYKNNLRKPLNKGLFYNKNYNSKSVIQYDKNKKIIKKWDCIKRASDELKINEGDIVSCCKNKLKTAGGYIWEYNKG